MSVVLVFVDGVGVGRNDPAVNPLARRPSLLSHFDDGTGAPLPAGGAVARVDPRLGVAGRPQSATGQATIFTGVNAPKLLGEHRCGFPNAPLRKLLAAESVFRQVADELGRATFANAYPRPYLELLGLPYDGPRAEPLKAEPRMRRRLQPSASTCAASAGGPLRTLEDAHAGRALTHDITGASRRRHGFDVPQRPPEDAAGIVLDLAEEHDFVLFEHFLLDEAGHAQDATRADAVLAELDAFLRALVDGLGRDDHLLVVSDHGNSEDVSTRSHTLNDVPLLVFGPRAKELAAGAKDLCDVAPMVVALAGRAAARLARPA